MRWIPFPMVRIVAFFIAGILVSISYPGLWSLQEVTVFLVVLVLLYFLTSWLLRRSKLIELATGIIGLSAIFLAGYLNTLIKNEALRPDALIQNKFVILAYRVKLISPNEEKELSRKRTGLVQAVRTSFGWQPTTGKVNLYWPKKEPIETLDYGDILLVRGQPQKLLGPQNPHEFDLKRFLSLRNIYHQHYILPDTWSLLEKSKDRGLLFHANRARSWSTRIITEFVPAPREQAIVMAFVLGVTDGIDDELRQAYAATGAMHALAVSGLHVSILYGLLLFFFRPLSRSAGGRWIIALVSLFALWSYAFITGLSPSVLRAVTMFSFVAIARPVERTSNIYNTLAASAFFLLIYDPYFILSVGFQLSYLAVLGIVLLQRPLYNLWEPKSGLVDRLWQISCVSMAAQIATFALGMLYFHQFPLYFLISNFFVIPGSFVILIGGVLLLIISPFSWLASLLGLVLQVFVKVLNSILFWTEDLPLSVIGNIHLSLVQCGCLMGLTCGLIILFHTRKFYWVLMMSALTLVFSIECWSRLVRLQNASDFTIYRVQGHSMLEWTEKGHAFFIADSALLNDHSGIRYHIMPNRLAKGILTDHSLPERYFNSSRGLRFYSLAGKTFLLIQSRDYELPETVTVDYLVISRNAVGSLKKLVNHVNFGCLVFDSSNSLRYCARLESEAQALQKDCYSVLKEGAFIVNL